ncbi:pentapeptide repeat-containing protein [Akkermansiaceae bacterium]|nr:pentapeptide repeat-containing protein [Akkermansiaceae bacterium]
MKIISLFLVLLFSAFVIPVSAQIGPDGTGVVKGYAIGPDANLTGANLTGANLSGANLTRADLKGANLTEADLRRTILSGADITGVDFRGADITGAVLGSYPRFDAIITGFSNGNYEEIQTLKTSDTTNTAAIATNTAATAANTTNITANTTRIEAIEAQLALLADALAAKDAEIAEKNERIAQLEEAKDERIAFLEEAKVADVVRNLLDEKDDEIAILEQRPTQTEFNAVVTERDARPTPEEIQDARTGSVILTPSEDGTVKLKLEIEESSDLEVWENNEESVEVELPLTEGKKFLRFALK